MGCYVWVGGDIEAWGDDNWNAIGEGKWEEGGENERNECKQVRHYFFKDGGIQLTAPFGGAGTSL